MAKLLLNLNDGFMAYIEYMASKYKKSKTAFLRDMIMIDLMEGADMLKGEIRSLLSKPNPLMTDRLKSLTSELKQLENFQQPDYEKTK